LLTFSKELSNRYPDIGFIHAYPGVVNTPIMNNLPWYARLPAKALSFLYRSADDCGEFMVNGLLAKEYQKGWYMLGQYAEVLPRNKYATEQLRKKLWDHSVELTGYKP
jgi:hypothetical protein